MANSSNSHRQSVFGGCFCLLAALFLYAPLAGAAWSAHSMACCTGDQCPIRGHHHQTPAASHEDCEHNVGMSACSMSCCQDQERVATGAVLFILPLFFSSRRRHTILQGDWSSDVCSSD